MTSLVAGALPERPNTHTIIKNVWIGEWVAEYAVVGEGMSEFPESIVWTVINASWIDL